jgi:hypothetical protein
VLMPIARSTAPMNSTTRTIRDRLMQAKRSKRRHGSGVAA